MTVQVPHLKLIGVKLRQYVVLLATSTTKWADIVIVTFVFGAQLEKHINTTLF